jgi:hypothetical protein
MRRTRYRSEYRDGSYGFPQIAFIDQINQSINTCIRPITIDDMILMILD